MEQALKDQTVIVTGAARGIGLAQASHFAGLGANVVIVDSGCQLDGTGQDGNIATKVAKDIGRRGGVVEACVVDVRAGNAFETVMKQTLGRFSGVNAIVLNAGIHHNQSIRSMTSVHVRLALSYLESVFDWTTQAIAYWSQNHQAGCLLLTTSARAWSGRAQQAHLSALDAGVVALVRSAALELSNTSVRINAIAPSAYTRQTKDTAEYRSIDPAAMDPALIAPLAAYLISKHARALNGEVLAVEGHRWFSYRTLQTSGVFSPADLDFHEIPELAQKALRDA